VTITIDVRGDGTCEISYDGNRVEVLDLNRNVLLVEKDRRHANRVGSNECDAYGCALTVVVEVGGLHRRWKCEVDAEMLIGRRYASLGWWSI
jgi:hypothetical protein